jgi:ribonuclease R
VRERAAVVAEREFIDVQRVRFMENRVGEEFDAVVTSVTSFGLFVQPESAFVEGLVRLADLNDYYVFDEARLAAVGKRTGRTFRIGTPVKVQLTAANPITRTLDFKLLGEGGGDRSHHRSGGRGGRHRRR